jgi:hypothetical protein
LEPLEPLPPEIVAEAFEEPPLAGDDEEAAQENHSEEEDFDAEPVVSQEQEARLRPSTC